MSNLRAAAQQALEALEYLNVTAEHRVDDRIPDAAIVALRAALEQEEPDAKSFNDGVLEGTLRERQHWLEQQEQEPVAWMREGWGPDCGPYVEFYRNDEMGWRDRNGWTPLYTNPPRREWQGLTEQRDELLEALRDLVDAMTGRLDGETTALHNALIVIAKAEGKS